MSVSYPQTTPIGVKFTWDTTSEQAAQLIAEGNLRHNVIASELQIGMSTINSWKRHPEFKMRVDFHLDRLCQEIGTSGSTRSRSCGSGWTRSFASDHKTPSFRRFPVASRVCSLRP
jgi:hypothetical protein